MLPWLPDEACKCIFSYLSNAELERLSLVSKQWRVRVLNDLTEEEIKKKRHAELCGRCFCSVVSEDAEVYTWGVSNLVSLPTTGNKPTKTTSKQDMKIVQVSVGSAHFIALNDQGAVLAWGLQRGGRLGLSGREVFDAPTLVESLSSVKIVDVSAGGSHSAVVDESGMVYTTGIGMEGQLGHSDYFDISKFKGITHLKDNGVSISNLSCGPSHTLAIATGGDLYSWGDNESNQLGFSSTKTVNKPTKVPGIDDVFIVGISTCQTQSIALTQKGNIYIWGMDEKMKKYNIPTHVSHPRRFVSVSSGNFHYVLQTAEGKLYFLYLYVLGNTPRVHWSEVEFEEKVSCSCAGDDYTLIITRDGDVFTWGNGSRGAIGHGSTDDVPYPKKIDGISGVEICPFIKKGSNQ